MNLVSFENLCYGVSFSSYFVSQKEKEKLVKSIVCLCNTTLIQKDFKLRILTFHPKTPCSDFQVNLLERTTADRHGQTPTKNPDSMCNFSRAKHNSLFDLPIKKRGKKQFIVRFFWHTIEFIRFIYNPYILSDLKKYIHS